MTKEESNLFEGKEENTVLENDTKLEETFVDNLKEMKEISEEIAEGTLEEFKKEKLESGQKNFTLEKCYEKRDKFRFDLSIQRNEVWKKDKKSLFIHSMLLGYPLANIYSMSQKDGYYWILDGKQRLTTFFDFMDNKFPLEGEDVSAINGEVVLGKTFEELSEDLQNELKGLKISITNFKNLSVEQRDQLFFRLNNGEALSKMEQTRALSGKFMNEVVDLLGTDLFKEKLRMTEKARIRFKDVEVALQTLLFLEKGDDFKGLGSVAIRDYVQNKKDFGNEDPVFNRIYKIMGYLEAATTDFDKKSLRIFKKSNIPVIVSVAEKSKEKNMKASDFGNYLTEFFLNYGPNEDGEYLLLLKAGSSNKENVLRREEILERYMQKNFMIGMNKKEDTKVS